MPDISEVNTTIKDWVEQYSDYLYSWALYKSGSKETAEDLVQETFLAATLSMPNFKGESHPKTWLFSILKNKLNDYFRKAYRRPFDHGMADLSSVFDSEGNWRQDQRPQQWKGEPEHLLDDYDFEKVLHSCLGNLPEHWFAAIRLKYIDGRKGALICQELGISDTNYWQVLHRAKLQLRKCLEVNWFKK